MPITDINPGTTFIGFIPHGSNKEHLAIILFIDNPEIRYCYCTSQTKLLKYHKDYFIIEKEIMRQYFPNSFKETYIVLSPDDLSSMLYITFKTCVDTGEFTLRKPLDNNLFKKLIEAYLVLDSIPQRIKQKLIESISLKLT
jgi:hypothetical protein